MLLVVIAALTVALVVEKRRLARLAVEAEGARADAWLALRRSEGRAEILRMEVEYANDAAAKSAQDHDVAMKDMTMGLKKARDELSRRSYSTADTPGKRP
jgi:hypothetical protein